jgi:hypothetical protein
LPRPASRERAVRRCRVSPRVEAFTVCIRSVPVGWEAAACRLRRFLPGVLAALTSTHRGRRRTAPPSTAIENLKESHHCLAGAKRTARTPCRNRHARNGHRRINITQGASVAMIDLFVHAGLRRPFSCPSQPEIWFQLTKFRLTSFLRIR